jgi:hypothetical protein
LATAAARDQLTPQQRDAVFRREVSVVLSSGAGCGKTHVLTRRYLSHLEEDGAEVGQIVAITFTDRAARQMRDRIRRAVLTHLGRAESPEDVSRYLEHLRGLETAQISTIHAFCGNLLRQHAVEAGLDPRFDILQDYLAANLQREALISCLQGLLTADTEPGRDLRELVLLYGWRPTVEMVQRLMTEEDAAVRQRWLRRSAAEVARAWRAYTAAALRRLSERGLPEDRPHPLAAAHDALRRAEDAREYGPLAGRAAAAGRGAGPGGGGQGADRGRQGRAGAGEGVAVGGGVRGHQEGLRGLPPRTAGPAGTFLQQHTNPKRQRGRTGFPR